MQLLEHFKELTLHPKNAEELKGLILQLAVQGKLTKQWRAEHPLVETASILLKKIESEKERLIKEKKIKKEKPLPNISKDEIHYELPERWIWCRLGDIITLKSGQDLTPNEYSDINQIGVPYITGASNLQNEEVIISRWTNKPRSKAYEGDLLFTCKGSGVGKMGWLKEVEAHIARQIMAVNTIGSSLDFIKLFLDIKLKYFKKVANGLIPGIDRKTILEIPFPLPPLEEQKVIVEVVNQLFVEVEQLEALTKDRIQLKADFVTSALNQLTQAAEQDTASQWTFLQQHFGTFFTEKANIKKLRESILQLAVQGKLTRDWRALRQAQGKPVEHSSSLLEKIKAEKEQLIKAGKIKKEKPLPEISEDEIPYDLPKDWVWCRLGNLVETITSGSRDWAKYYSTSGSKFITMGNLSRGSFGLRLDKIRYVRVPENGEGTRTKLKPWDFLISITGDVGNMGLIPENFGDAYINQHTALVRYIKNLRGYFMGYYFLSPLAIYQFHEPQRGIKNSFRLTDIQYMIVPLPPIEEQKALVEKINSLMALCDNLEQEIETHQTNQEQWMLSCLR